MNFRSILLITALVVALCSVNGCASDPVAKRKESGIHYKIESGEIIHVYEGLRVFYKGEKYHVEIIDPPYVGLCGGKYKFETYCKEPLMVKIEDKGLEFIEE
jgi:hypothetical protein